MDLMDDPWHSLCVLRRIDEIHALPHRQQTHERIRGTAWHITPPPLRR